MIDPLPLRPAEEIYLIWSIEHTAWWKPAKSGYTQNYLDAGVYSMEEAFRVSARANWRTLNEVPVPHRFFDYQESLHKLIEAKKP